MTMHSQRSELTGGTHPRGTGGGPLRRDRLRAWADGGVSATTASSSTTDPTMPATASDFLIRRVPHRPGAAAPSMGVYRPKTSRGSNPGAFRGRDAGYV